MQVQQQLVIRKLTEDIASGRYPEGSWLPTTAVLARRHGCSRHAVARAFRHLSDRGVLKSTRRKGTCVLRRPALGRVLFMNSWDQHTNLLLQEAIAQALVGARLDVEFVPYLYHPGTGFDRLRQLAAQGARDDVLVTLTQERMPSTDRVVWERFAAAFRYRVAFQFEDVYHLPNSLTVLPDPVAAARLVAEHLLALGHRRIGVVSGSSLALDAASQRHAKALAEMISLVGAECFLYDYGQHSVEGVAAFVNRHRCTAWWAITDHQALEQIALFQRAGLRVPDDISVMGSNDTPWAANPVLPLTTLSLDPPAIARAIAEAVEAAFLEQAVAPGERRRFIRPVLVARASTASVGGLSRQTLTGHPTPGGHHA